MAAWPGLILPTNQSVGGAEVSGHVLERLLAQSKRLHTLVEEATGAAGAAASGDKEAKTNHSTHGSDAIPVRIRLQRLLAELVPGIKRVSVPGGKRKLVRRATEQEVASHARAYLISQLRRYQATAEGLPGGEVAGLAPLREALQLLRQVENPPEEHKRLADDQAIQDAVGVGTGGVATLGSRADRYRPLERLFRAACRRGLGAGPVPVAPAKPASVAEAAAGGGAAGAADGEPGGGGAMDPHGLALRPLVAGWCVDPHGAARLVAGSGTEAQVEAVPHAPALSHVRLRATCVVGAADAVPAAACSAASGAVAPLRGRSFRRGRTVVTLPGAPGLYILPCFLSLAEQRYWICRSLTGLCGDPYPTNITNLVARDQVAAGGSLAPGQRAEGGIVVEPSPWLRLVQQKEPELDDRLNKLTWSTLGYNYDWTNRVYPPGEGAQLRPFPTDVATLAMDACRLARQAAACSPTPPAAKRHRADCKLPRPGDGSEEDIVEPYLPEAAIVNYYAFGRGMGGHVDDSEPSRQPVVSVSLGCAAVFLFGGADRSVAPVPVLVRSGDVVLMAGAARRCVHGVSTILPGSCPDLLSPCELVEGDSDAPAMDEWPSRACITPESPPTAEGQLQQTGRVMDLLRSYLERHRININVREVEVRGSGGKA